MLKLFTKGWRKEMKSEAETGFGVCDGIWTPVVQTGAIVIALPNAELANKAVEVTGLVAPAELTIGATTYDVSNGNIVVFNITGNIVAALGAVAQP